MDIQLNTKRLTLEQILKHLDIIMILRIFKYAIHHKITCHCLTAIIITGFGIFEYFINQKIIGIFIILISLIMIIAIWLFLMLRNKTWIILNKALSNNIYEVATKTPLEKAKLLSADLQNNILFKREELQPTFSFKVRGAISKINSLPRNTLELGVIASSAGNHGLGVALAAKTKNISATIVVPKNASKQKISLIRKLGANVILHGKYYDDAEKLAKK